MIKAKNISGIPSQYLTNGEFWFDLPADWVLRKNKSVQNLDAQNKVSQEIALTFLLDRSPKNNLLLANYTEPIQVEIYQNGELLEFDELRVNDDLPNGFDVEVVGSSWAEKLQRLKLSDLNLGQFNYTLPNVLAAWANTSALAVPTLAHYGGWNDEGKATRKDLRFWFNIGQLMKACFCAIGWNFKSEFWETWPGNQLYTYISDRLWYSYDGKQDPGRVEVSSNVSFSFDGYQNDLIFPIKDYDPFNLYNSVFLPGQYLYPINGQEDIDLIFKLQMQIFLPATPADQPAPTWLLYLYQDRPKDGEFFNPLAEQYQGIPGEAQTINVDIDLRIEGVKSGDSFGILVLYQDVITPGYIAYPWEIRPGATCKFLPDPPRYIENDSIPLGQLLSSEVTGLDLFKAIQHLISGHSEPNFSSRTVELFPPYACVFEGNAKEGFFQDKILDWQKLTQGKSRKKKNLEDNKPRFIDLKFKASTDAFIESRNYPTEYWMKRVNFGGRVEEPLTLENPLFEPTIEIPTTVEEIGIKANASTVDETPALMALWDNDDGQLSRELGARIGFFHGLVKQQKPGGTEDFEFVFEDGVRSLFGYISQWPTRKVTTAKFYRPVYGSSSSDFYSTCWRLFIIKDMFPAEEYNFLISMTEQHYRELNFRCALMLNDQGGRLFKATKVQDHRGGQITTPVTVYLEAENQIK